MGGMMAAQLERPAPQGLLPHCIPRGFPRSSIIWFSSTTYPSSAPHLKSLSQQYRTEWSQLIPKYACFPTGQVQSTVDFTPKFNCSFKKKKLTVLLLYLTSGESEETMQPDTLVSSATLPLEAWCLHHAEQSQGPGELSSTVTMDLPTQVWDLTSNFQKLNNEYHDFTSDHWHAYYTRLFLSLNIMAPNEEMGNLIYSW